MTIKTEPFLSGKWGWEEGEGDWKDGVDENFLKFSYMINATLDSFVSTLPPSPVDGTAYFLNTDNTLNARVDGEWRKFPIPKGYVVTMKADGAKFEWTGTTFAATTNLADKTKLDGIATGATLNSSDASLRDRATHTGAQVISTVTGLQAALDGKLPLTGGSIAGGLTVSSSIQSPLLLTYNSVPVHFFKDTDTSGTNIRGSTVYSDMDGVGIGNVGFVAGDGKYEIINTGRPVKITSSVLDVVGDITTASLNASGNVTASTFNGSGAGLTGVPTTAITGITTVGANLVQTANPNAVTFPRINADNTVTYGSAANLLSDIAAVGVAGTQTISGDKTFSGATLFTGATTTNNLTANDSVTVSGADPHLYIKDSNTSGSTITGSLEFKDSGGNTKGSIGYNGDGLLRIINGNGGGVGVDTAVRVTGTLPFITLTDTDTSGTIAKGFISFVDSLGATNAALGMIDGDGRFKFSNPTREFYFDGSNVKSLGTLEAVGSIIGAIASIAGTLTAGGLSTGGTVGASGTITSGTSVSAPTMSGATANFGTYSGGAATLTGTSQLSKLGVATASLGSDVLAVNGTSTFYGHAVVNGNVTATALIGGGASITGLTKGQVGLGNADNTSDVNKPISTATQTALNNKVSTSGNESVSGLKTFTTGIQTDTVNAGNGTQAIAIDSFGKVSLSGDIVLPSGRTIFFGADEGRLSVSGSELTYRSYAFDRCDILLRDAAIELQGGIFSTPNYCGLLTNSGGQAFWVDGSGNSFAGGALTAANFYGNGYNLTQLNASEVKNGLLPSNIFPATISVSSITFAGNHIAKGGTAYNLLDITSTASILRDSAGFDVFNASTTDLALKRANNIVLSASSTTTQIFNHSGSIRANFDASNTQIFSPATVPFISATTTTAAITSGNGASCLNINSSGGGIMKHQAYTVATVPAASSNTDCSIVVTDAVTGRGLFLSDGTNWRNVANGTILA